MIQTQVQLTEEQARALSDLARVRQSSVAVLIRQGIDQLIQQAARADKSALQRRAIAAAGRFHSGQSNISMEHDRYLVEAYPA